MWELMNCCWSYKPAERPTGQAILQLLEPRIIEGVGPADEVESVTQGSHYPQLPIGKDLVNSLDLFQVRKILASVRCIRNDRKQERTNADVTTQL